MAGRGMKVDLIGVVLAGGQSSRMGRDKAMLEYKGSTLLANQVDCLAALCDRVVVSGNCVGFDCLQDQLAGIGPLAGVHAAARQFPDSTLLFVAVDMPLIDAAHLRALINSHQARHYSAQPLPAFFPDAKQVLLHIERLVESQSDDYALQHLHRRLGSCAMPALDETVFANLNNPADWQYFTTKPSA
jgi:molybdenum cofactor guanylyltransferase